MFCSFFTDRCGRKPSGFAGQRTVWPKNLLPVSCPPKCPPSCPLKCQLYVQQLESLLSFFDLGNESLSHGTFAMQHFHALLIGVSVGVSQGHLCAVVPWAVTRTAAFGQLFSAQSCFSELSLGEVCHHESNPYCLSCGYTGHLPSDAPHNVLFLLSVTLSSFYLAFIQYTPLLFL